MNVNPLVVVLETDLQFSDNERAIAVGVSGGGDSMALLHMLSRWAEEQGRDIVIHALTIDHALRMESCDEADMVARWVSVWPRVVHHILRWNHDNGQPQSSVMESARVARYAMMKDYCYAHHIQTLCVAHHADDQIETFLFRLAKGSGLDGLSAMNENVIMTDNLRLYRPLLGCTHQDLISYCLAHDIPWIEDPSNQNGAYLRPRLRQSREILEKEGLSGKRLQKTINRLGRASNALDHYAQTAYAAAAEEHGQGQAVYIDWSVLGQYHEEIIIRVLQRALMVTGGTRAGYPPRLERVEDMVTQILSGRLRGKSATLHGCLVSHSKTGDKLEIVRG